MLRAIKILTLLMSVSFSNSVFATCTGSSCDGKDPLREGCSNGAITAASKIHDDPYNVVRVDLRWSPVCKTNWSRISYTDKASTMDPNLDKRLDPDLLTATIHRVTGNKVKYVGSVNVKDGIYWSPMVNGNGLKAFAEGNAIVKGFTDSGIKTQNVILSTPIK